MCVTYRYYNPHKLEGLLCVWGWWGWWLRIGCVSFTFSSTLKLSAGILETRKLKQNKNKTHTHTTLEEFNVIQFLFESARAVVCIIKVKLKGHFQYFKLNFGIRASLVHLVR